MKEEAPIVTEASCYTDPCNALAGLAKADRSLDLPWALRTLTRSMLCSVRR